MKNYSYFLQEASEVTETDKALKKRFKGTKDSTKKTGKSQLRGSKIGSVIIPKVKPSVIRDFLISLGYKVEEEFGGFIDMWYVAYKGKVVYKATIVSNDKSKDIEVRLSSNASR
jgi:hypothetical protein